MAVALEGDSAGRAIGYVAVGDAVAVVHGTHKLPWAPLLGLAFALTGPLRRITRAVAWLWRRGRTLLKELFLLPSLTLALLTFAGPRLAIWLWRAALPTLHRGGLGFGGLSIDWLRLLCLRSARLAGFILAAAPAAAMPL